MNEFQSNTFSLPLPYVLLWHQFARRGLQCHGFNPLQYLPTSKPGTLSTEDLILTNPWQERKQSQNK
jgi:hypothetical protein